MQSTLSKEVQILINKFKAEQYSDVIKKISILLKKNNENDFLWNLSGLCFQRLNRVNDAIFTFEKAIKLNPKNIAAKNNLALSLKNIKNYQRAENLMKEILENNPNYLNTIVNLANLKNETYYFDDALAYYKKALEINKNIPEIYLNISNILQSNNKIEEAKSYLLKSLNLDENFTKSDQNLSMLQNYKNNNNKDHFNNIINKLENNELSDEKKMYLYFALGKIFEDLKEYNNAFENFKNGNEIQYKNQKSKINFYKKLSTDIKNFFTKIDFKKLVQPGNGQKNIFILGLPRSGTTLLEKIITSHSQVSSVSEVNFLYNKINEQIIQDNKLNHNSANFFLKKNIAKEYNDFLKNFNIQTNYIVDKTLTNFWYIGFIKIFFPNSKIIHSYRNSEDNCLSIFKNFFIGGETWVCNDKEIAEYYLIYSDLMNFWNELLKGEILNVKYEELVNDSEKKIRGLIDFCGLKWEDNCLKHEKNKNPIKTLSVNQANQPIYSTSINSSNFYKDKLVDMFSILRS